ncbi:MAG TPA: aminotransferase class III-fold pyridoxal phosphate-dependent enzyme, partial [Aestuariivirga sp.]|nr:aminotransferase class III-fold pyridoxal phosphate-dependent enzyme [Aestuariivirga sp.]
MDKPKKTTGAWDASPNNLEQFWMGFTPNRAFKRRPRMISRAKDMYYYDLEGKPVMDAAAGLWCVNAGHCRDHIVTAIQDSVAELDFAPTFQYGHPKVFQLASRIAMLAPGDLNHVFF